LRKKERKKEYVLKSCTVYNGGWRRERIPIKIFPSSSILKKSYYYFLLSTTLDDETTTTINEKREKSCVYGTATHK